MPTRKCQLLVVIPKPANTINEGFRTQACVRASPQPAPQAECWPRAKWACQGVSSQKTIQQSYRARPWSSALLQRVLYGLKDQMQAPNGVTRGDSKAGAVQLQSAGAVSGLGPSSECAQRGTDTLPSAMVSAGAACLTSGSARAHMVQVCRMPLSAAACPSRGMRHACACEARQRSGVAVQRGLSSCKICQQDQVPHLSL